jgi:small redox-active disulfide protein 2
MLIQILGTDCSRCNKLADLTDEAATQADIDYTLEKVTEIDKIIAMGVMATPALVVDGKLKCSGRVPNIEQIMAFLNQGVFTP